MPRRDLTFRVFVSSTFSDFLRERHALQNIVFPRLREYCQQSGTRVPGVEPRFQAIDLRWGVAREAALDQQTMNICLQELHRCQQLSPKPNFIVLMGDRYGWIPLPPEIAADEFESLLAQMSDDERALIRGKQPVAAWSADQTVRRIGWYRRDDNAVPPQYVLQPRTIDFPADASANDHQRIQQEEFADWSRIEAALSAALTSAIAQAGWAEDDPRRPKFEHSATHQEITHGALAVDDADEHVLCYFRTIEGLPPNAAGYRDLNARGQQDATALQRLGTLRDELAEAIPEEHLLEYAVQWEDAGDPEKTGVTGDQPDADLQAFCERVEQDLRQIIDRELDLFQQEAATHREQRLHAEFTGQHTTHFVGRDDLLQQIQDHCTSETAQPLVIAGVSGSGKTALMAAAGERLVQAAPNAVVITRFIGATPESTELRTLLRSLCWQLGLATGDEGELPSELSELAREFEKRLGAATADHPVYVLLDALDQLSAAENAHSLWWLPRKQPEHGRLVVSVLERDDASGDAHRAAQRMLPDALVTLQAFSPAEGERLLDAWLAAGQRTVGAKQRERLLEGFRGCPYPLYLRIAVDEACRWHSWEEPEPLPSDVPALLAALFDRLALPQNHGRRLVERSLGYLGAARRGLAEDELLDVLSRDTDVLGEFRARSPDSPVTERLPVVVWSRLFVELESNLAERQAYGAPVLSFYHRQVREAVERSFLTEPDRLRSHQHLADYFREQDYWRESLEQQRARAKRLPPTPRPANIRKVDELPYHVLEVAKLAGKDDPASPYWDAVADLMTDWQFLEAKAEAQPFVEPEESEQEEAAS
ncbi:NACHT domain protein [Maioricimonas rarisocia]|uniref:NACHT domain protein n=1 Tax=Maioricimonas rarisocia TaxID=2528026 RepID=A0A517ZFL2_9PLAN|nr:AAA family ATPase [Maioricimonas rarisocia]QDU41278.1 NACHT domain protein [Maioricimonas rarisocia]